MGMASLTCSRHARKSGFLCVGLGVSALLGARRNASSGNSG